MTTHNPYHPPVPRDFEVTPAMRLAGLAIVPPAVYDKYRHRLVSEVREVCEVSGVYAGGRVPLIAFLQSLVQSNNFMSAYFHLTPKALHDTCGLFPLTPALIESTSLDDWPFQTALDVARNALRASGRFGFHAEDRAMVGLLAFVYPSALLRSIDVMVRGGADVSEFMNSTFCNDHCRYLRSAYTHDSLMALYQRHRNVAYLLSYALDDRFPFVPRADALRDRAARIASVLGWSQILLREALKSRRFVRP